MELLNKFKKNILVQKEHIFLIFYLFIFLYAPPVLVDFNIVFILFLFSIVQIIRRYKNELKLILSDVTVKKFFLGILVYSLYFFVILLVNFLFFQKVNLMSYFTVIYSYFLFFPITLVCCLYVICYCIEKNFDVEILIQDFIIACLFQAIICILSLISRDFKETLLEIMYIHTKNDLLTRPWLNHRRFFGLSRNLLDLFGLGTGIIGGITILQIRKHNKYIFFIPFIFILTFLNAKTGIIIILISLMIFVMNENNRQLIVKFIKKYLFILLFLIFGLIMFLYILSPETFSWIINDFLSFLPNSNNEGIGSLLFSQSFWTFPSNIFEIILGTGHNIFAVEGFPHSDVGYVNEIWKTGILGFVVLYGNIVYLFIKLIKSKVYIYKYLGLFFLFSFFLFMIKGQVIGYNPATPVIFTIALYICYEKGKKTDE